MGWRLPQAVKEKSREASTTQMVDPFGICHGSGSVITLEKLALLYEERDLADYAYVVRRGLCFSFRHEEDGRRQIIDLAFPGDFVGLEALTQPHYVSGVSALTSAEVMAYPADEFTRQCYADPALSRALVECIARERAILTKRLVGVVHRSASRRIAHFLLEVRVRAIAASSACPPYPAGNALHGSEEPFSLKLPQAVIADALGLSLVHVSRTLNRLRSDGLIDYCSSGLRYRNLEGLKSVALWEGLSPWFDPV